MKLLIVESPAKCSKIQSFLGAGWRVVASMGHIRSLKQTLDAVGIGRNFEPEYEFMMTTKKKALTQLRDAARTCSEIYLASDDDREGEAISFAVCEWLHLPPQTTPRAVFHEITEKAVRHAIEHPRIIDMNRVLAQQARAMLDMLIGFTISPLLWKHVGSALSAGRCQTPALRIVVEREDEIRAFVSNSTWRLLGIWNGIGGVMEDELEDEESVRNYLELLSENTHAYVVSNDTSTWTQRAPPPLITSTLQQQASSLFSMSPKMTMQIAQKLYEAGYITYMRTDCATLSEEAQKDARKWVEENYGTEYLGNMHTGTPVATVLSQDAHEAIRPTHITTIDISGDWVAKKLYRLIWQRTLQSVMAPATGQMLRLRYKPTACEDFLWKSELKKTDFLGWMRAGKVANLDGEEQEEPREPRESSQWTQLSAIAVGDTVVWHQLSAAPHISRAPGRYTEATLIRELETRGIGRPSTFASLLSAIQEKGYVQISDVPSKKVEQKVYTLEKMGQWPPNVQTVTKEVGGEKKKLVPTDLGRSVLSFILHHFQDLFEYSFTSQMEIRLDNVAEGREAWKQILADTWVSYKERYDTLKKGTGAKKTSARVRDFGNSLKAVMTRKGPLLLIEEEPVRYLGWPDGIAFHDLTEERAFEFARSHDRPPQATPSASPQQPSELWNGRPFSRKKGPYGDYVSVDMEGGEVIRVSITPDMNTAQIVARLDTKASEVAATRAFKDFEIRVGQYGPYILKKGLKKKVFIPVPKGVDIATLHDSDVEALYNSGLERKRSRGGGRQYKNTKNK